MKTKEKTEKPTKGRAAFIHGLRDGGASKPDALAKTQAKFQCAKGLFERIWKRKAKGAAEEPKPAKAKTRAAKPDASAAT